MQTHSQNLQLGCVKLCSDGFRALHVLTNDACSKTVKRKPASLYNLTQPSSASHIKVSGSRSRSQEQKNLLDIEWSAFDRNAVLFSSRQRRSSQLMYWVNASSTPDATCTTLRLRWRIDADQLTTWWSYRSLHWRLWLTFHVARMLRWWCVPRIDDVFRQIAVVSAAEADVVRRRLQWLYEVPFAIHVDHADLPTNNIHHSYYSQVIVSVEYSYVVTAHGFNSRCGTLTSLCNQPPRSTQPGHPFAGRRNECQPKGADVLLMGSRGRYGLCAGSR